MNTASKTVRHKPPDASQLRQEFQRELESILWWWEEYLLDNNGGFYGRMDGKGVLFPKADRGVILNTRILWTYSAAARMTGNTQYKRIAEHAWEYLNNHFWDQLEGGLFWMVDWQGNPVNTQKQIYAQAFGIYAFSEYFLLTQDPMVLDKAIEIFWLVEKYSNDKLKGGYFSAFARDWSAMEDIRLSEKDANEAKIMNTHLHLLEAYTNMFRAKPSPSVKAGLENVLEIFINKFYKAESGNLHIYFDEDWNPKSELVSFGHDIESSWLIWEALELLGKETQEKHRSVVLNLAESTYSKGIDTDGALFHEIHADGKLDTDKHWWPQTEAVVGFWNAWQLSGKVEYAEASTNTWHFIKNNLIDKVNGEWHWRVNGKGEPVLTEDKAGPWKGPYHNGRMCMEMLRRLESQD